MRRRGCIARSFSVWTCSSGTIKVLLTERAATAGSSEPRAAVDIGRRLAERFSYARRRIAGLIEGLLAAGSSKPGSPPSTCTQSRSFVTFIAYACFYGHDAREHTAPREPGIRRVRRRPRQRSRAKYSCCSYRLRADVAVHRSRGRRRYPNIRLRLKRAFRDGG